MALVLRWQQSSECRKDGPVWPGGAWPGELLAHDRDLMAQHEELGVLGRLPPHRIRGVLNARDGRDYRTCLRSARPPGLLDALLDQHGTYLRLYHLSAHDQLL
jgi:hypothetical protein